MAFYEFFYIFKLIFFMNIQVKGFVNAKIYRKFNPIKISNSIVTFGERILYIGNESKAKKLVEKFNGEVIDLKGKIILPGFIDSHIHLDSLSIYLKTLDLRNVRSIFELKLKLKEYYEKNKDLSFIYGRGWDQENFEEKRWPNRNDLDEIVRDKPVILERICGHAAVLNSKALELLKDSDFVLKENGKQNGIILEKALNDIRKILNFNKEEIKKMLLETFNYLLSFGITCCGFVSCDFFYYKILEELNKEKKLPIRIRVYLKLNDLNYLKYEKIQGNNFLKILGIKIFTDGSLGARTAALNEPYNDDIKNFGVILLNEEELQKIVKEVNDLNFQLAIHAIGDKAIDLTINSLEKVKDDIKKLRHRIEHASVIREDQIEKLSKLKVCVCVQPHFIKSDFWVVKRVGEKRAKWVYPFKSMFKKIILGFSTDAPVEPVNPFETIYSAVKRDNEELIKYTNEECLSLEESFYCYTLGSAYLLFEEKNLGSLDVGKFADFIVLDKDPFEVNLEEIKNLRILMTVVGGEIKFLT